MIFFDGIPKEIFKLLKKSGDISDGISEKVLEGIRGGFFKRMLGFFFNKPSNFFKNPWRYFKRVPEEIAEGIPGKFLKKFEMKFLWTKLAKGFLEEHLLKNLFLKILRILK